MIILPDRKVYGALTSVTLSGLPTLNNMSDGRGYFLASGVDKTYTFSISVIQTDSTPPDYLQITIPTRTGNIVTYWDCDGAGAANSITPAGSADIVNTTPPGDWANGVATIEIRFYLAAEATTNATRTITAEGSDGSITEQGAQSLTYGIASNIRALNFSQDGEATDGLILPDSRAGSFDVTGMLIYDLPGISSETAPDAVADTDITSVVLQLRNMDDNSLTWTHGTTETDNDLIYTIPSTQSIPARTLGYYWQVYATFAGSAGSEASPTDNRLSLESNTVRVTQIRFLNGTGRGPTHPAPDNIANYYRGYGLPGTLIEITAQMQVNSGSGQAMNGNTTLTVNYTDGTNTGDFTTTINSGSTVGTAAVEFDNTSGFLDTWLSDSQTAAWTYQVNGISGNNYGAQLTGDGNSTPVTNVIYWDRNDPPAHEPTSPVPALTKRDERSTTSSITIYWEPINTSSGAYDGDFYEYKVFFREYDAADTTPYLQWDGDEDEELRGLSNNPWPVSASPTHFDSRGWKYTVIPELKIYTRYQYYITAVDIFGNENDLANLPPDQIGTPYEINTQPFSIGVSLSDGITQYDNNSFINDDGSPNPDTASRQLRETNIKVELTIFTGGDQPGFLKLWYTTGDINTSPDIVITNNAINQSAFEPDTLFSVDAVKTDTDKWIAYIPTTNPVIKYGNSVRFIVETSLNNISTFTDSEIEPPPNQNPNDDEWTFYVGVPTTFVPWPVRVLNNVITNKTPVAYPAYYLSFDALVSIKVYDIKGRPVATLLDRAFRRGGQNIKENGWMGLNKNRKKLGVGLYYIHFKAKRIFDSKIILNKFKKVVIAK